MTPTVFRAGLAALCALIVGCASSKKGSPEVLIADPSTAWVESTRELERGKAESARTLCESVDFRFAADRRGELEPLMKICIADATFYRGSIIDLIDARQLYLDFVTLFGDHPLAPYAQFQGGVCSLEQANHPSKDQSQTESAFQDLAEVERRYPGSPYSKAARDMIAKAQARLAEHEFLVGRFYLKRKNYKAAVRRFQVIVDYYPDYPETEKLYFHLGKAQLLEKQGDPEGRRYLERVVAEFPHGEYRQPAQRILATHGQPVELALE